MGWNDEGTTGPESGFGDSRSDHHVRSRTGSGFHYAIHESGYLHPLQKTHQATTKSVLLPFASKSGRLDLYGHCIPGRFSLAFHIGEVSKKYE